MAQNGYPHVVLRILFLYALGQVHGSTGDGAFGHEYDTTVLRFAESVFNQFFELVDLGRNLGNDGGLGSGSDSTVEGEESGIAAHDLDEEEALV